MTEGGYPCSCNTTLPGAPSSKKKKKKPFPVAGLFPGSRLCFQRLVNKPSRPTRVPNDLNCLQISLYSWLYIIHCVVLLVCY